MAGSVNLPHVFEAFGDGQLQEDGGLWLKFVRGFDPRKRDTKCLVGDYCVNVHERMYTGGGGREIGLPKLPFDFMFLFFGVDKGHPGAIAVGLKENPLADAVIDTPSGRWRIRISKAEVLPTSPMIIGSLDLDEETRQCPFYRFGWERYGSFGSGFTRRKGDVGLFG